MFNVPEQYRITEGMMGTPRGSGNNGAFLLGGNLRCIASDGGGWEHVSVSKPGKCPSWDEMRKAKDMFWDEEDCVMQLHPPKSAYVDCHPFCLHLWRPQDETIPVPPTWMVGPK